MRRKSLEHAEEEAARRATRLYVGDGNEKEEEEEEEEEEEKEEEQKKNGEKSDSARGLPNQLDAMQKTIETAERLRLQREEAERLRDAEEIKRMEEEIKRLGEKEEADKRGAVEGSVGYVVEKALRGEPVERERGECIEHV